MWMRGIKFTFLLLIILLSAFKIANAYEVSTHIKITEKAMGQAANYNAFTSAFTIDGNNSIAEGSNHEDDIISLTTPFVPVRSRHHFYDPTNGSGLTFSGCNLFPAGCKPSLMWGYRDSDNDYSWTKAREEMYTALTGKDFNEVTVASTADERKEYFQKMFRSVGQVMHLVQDLASPAHVRNDPHLPIPGPLAGDLYEKYAEAKYNDSWTTNYPTVNLSQFSGYWNAPQGLAFFTNKNFISQDTNFDNFNQSGQLIYNDPQIAGLVTKTETIQDQFGNTVQVQVDYVRNVVQDPFTGDIINNDQLSAFSVFDFEAQELLGKRVYTVNDGTMESAANVLVRRAVGYSAGLLNYFFRGQLKIIPVSGGIQIQNTSTETIGSYIDPGTGSSIGNISVYYDNTFSNRQLLTSYNLQMPLASGGTIDIPFVAPTDNILPGKYIIVFRGKLGEEEGAVIGKVTAPLQVFYRADVGGVEKIYRIGIDGLNKTVVFDNTDPNIVIDQMAVSPDQTKLAFTHGTNGTNISLIDFSTGQITPLLPNQGVDVNRADPGWSPNGDRIVFDRGLSRTLPSAPKAALFIRDLATGTETQLTPLPAANGETFGFATQPAWSPDGSLIAYSLRIDDPRPPSCVNDYVIALVDPAGQPQGHLTCDGAIAFTDRSPTWSPDNQSVVFSRQQPAQGLAHLYKVPRIGGAPAKLTDAVGNMQIEFNPAWSPDGDWIAVASTRDGDFDIWLVDPNTGAYFRNLTNDNPATDGNPAFGWVP